MSLKIEERAIGGNQPCFIIAELSANHQQDYDTAVKTIKEMKKAGADAVKLQTYTPDTITIDCDNEYFQIKQGTIWDGKTLYKLYEESYTPWEWQPKLITLANNLGLICFSSPFDYTAVDFLEELNVPAYKIASFEITDLPLIKYVALKSKPIIFSTGIASLAEIDEAIKTCRNVGNNQIIVLKCTSAYPTPLEDVNLKTLTDLKERFNTVVGISDHTIGNTVPIASIALGAKVIEKHFILNRDLKGPDASFSLEPEEFREMVRLVRDVEKALGEVTYELSNKLKRNRDFSRSLFVIKDINEGERFTKENIKSIRPGYGIAPKFIEEIIGKRAKTNIKRGTPLNWDMM